MLNRRRFIQQVALGSGAALGGQHLWGGEVHTGGSDRLGAIMPTRPFGRTGEDVTIFCAGGSHIAKSVALGEDPQALIETCLQEGVRFFDTAYNYGRGLSEELYGKYLTPRYRDHVFLMSKSDQKSGPAALAQLETSLQRLQTDYLDLWIVHSVMSADDVDNRLDNGVLEAFQQVKESGKVRYIGFSGHRDIHAHLRMLEREPDAFDYVQLPLNAVDISKPQSFTAEVLPRAVERGLAIGAMKTLAHGRFFGPASTDRFETDDPVIPNHLSVEEAIWYVLSQPISSLVSGTDKMVYLKENLSVVKRFAELSQGDQQQIVAKVEQFRLTPKLEGYRPDPRTLA